MGDLQLIQGHRDDEAYRRSLNQLSLDVVQYDVESWYQAGWWDDTFLCYSYLDGQTVVANMSAYKMAFIIDGQRIEGLQACFAITHPAYRKQGLCENLFKFILETDIPPSCIVYGLTVHETMKRLQLRHGFHLQPQSEFFLPLEPGYRPALAQSRRRWLDLTSNADRDLLMIFARERIPLSRTFDVEHTHHMLLFHCFSDLFKQTLAFLPDEDVIVSYKREGDRLHLYDLLARHDIDLSSVLASLLEENTSEVIFYFTPPEEHGLPLRCRALPTEEALFVRPALNCAGPIRYPILA